jgi:acyl carrier protein
MDTIEKLQEVFRDVFEDEGLELFPEMTADDYEAWDSLAHFQLVFGVERAFGVKFTTGEILKMKNVGEMVKLIDGKPGK